MSTPIKRTASVTRLKKLIQAPSIPVSPAALWGTVTAGPGTTPAVGFVWLRPSSTAVTDGSADVQVRYLTEVAPGVGANVRIEADRGDLYIRGASGVDDFPGSPFGMCLGVVTFNASGISSDTVPLAFPTGRFLVAPGAVAFMTSAPSGSGKCVVRTTGATTASGCVVQWNSGDGSALTFTGLNVMVLGIEMTSTTAAG